MLSQIARTITFFRTEAAARALAERGEMTEAEGYFVVPATGRDAYVIEVRDTDDGLLNAADYDFAEFA